jgi:hypothetical protein
MVFLISYATLRITLQQRLRRRNTVQNIFSTFSQWIKSQSRMKDFEDKTSSEFMGL